LVQAIRTTGSVEALDWAVINDALHVLRYMMGSTKMKGNILNGLLQQAYHHGIKLNPTSETQLRMMKKIIELTSERYDRHHYLVMAVNHGAHATAQYFIEDCQVPVIPGEGVYSQTVARPLQKNHFLGCFLLQALKQFPYLFLKVRIWHPRGYMFQLGCNVVRTFGGLIDGCPASAPKAPPPSLSLDFFSSHAHTILTSKHFVLNGKYVFKMRPQLSEIVFETSEMDIPMSKRVT